MDLAAALTDELRSALSDRLSFPTSDRTVPKLKQLLPRHSLSQLTSMTAKTIFLPEDIPAGPFILLRTPWHGPC
jgi:hypothetical protein